MICRTFRKDFIDQWGSGLDPMLDQELRTHALTCPRCAAYASQMLQTFSALGSSPNIQAPVGFKENVMKKLIAIQEGTNGPVQHRSCRPALWKPTLAVGSLVVLFIVVSLLSELLGTGTRAYAFADTVKALRAIRHVVFEATVIHGQGGGKFWAEVDAAGNIRRARFAANPAPQVESKEIFIQDGKLGVWMKQKKELIILSDPDLLAELRDPVDLLIPTYIIHELQAQQTRGKLDLVIDSPQTPQAPILVTATWKEPKPGRSDRDVFTIDPGSRLPIKLDRYDLTSGHQELAASIQYDYPRVLDPTIFQMNVPADVTRLDQTVKEIGLVQGHLRPEQVTVEATRQYFTALLTGDYEKAGMLFLGVPGKLLQESLEKEQGRVIRIVQIGPARREDQQGTPRYVVPCQVEWEKDGKHNLISKSYSVSPVANHPDHWTLTGEL